MRVPYPIRATLVALAGFAAFELAAHRAGWFDPTLVHDPYLGFPGTPPLYRPVDEDGERLRRTSPNKLGSYADVVFPEAKRPDELRAFVVGGSSVRSTHMRLEATFPEMLEVYLDELLPGRLVDVVNSGGGGTGSVQNLEVVREVLGYGPDLVVVYPEGGEKNMIPPAPQGLLAVQDDASPLRVAARRALSRSRLYLALRDAYQALLAPPPESGRLRGAFSAIALYAISRPFAPDTFTSIFDMKLDNVPVLMEHVIPQDVIDHAHERFERNLTRMAELAREARVPLVFVLPVRNPKASFNLRFHIAPEEIREGRIDAWRAAYEAGVAAKRAGRYEEAIERFLSVRALYVEDTDEILAFYLGQCLEAIGQHEAAAEEYSRPYLRHPMRSQIERVAERTGTPCVDPYPALLEAAGGRAPGFEFFTDSFHPTPPTNRVIARAILEVLRDEDVVEGLSDAEPREAERELDAVEARYEVPLFHRMRQLILAGENEEAVAIGRSIPEAEMKGSPVTPFYFGWALTRAGFLDEARTVYERMKLRWGDEDASWAPDMSTDEAIVENAFAGDIWAWF